MKRYMNATLLYAIFAMIGGVFYREFTRFHGFAAKTTLSVVHTHYFLQVMSVSPSPGMNAAISGIAGIGHILLGIGLVLLLLQIKRSVLAVQA